MHLPELNGNLNAFFSLPLRAMDRFLTSPLPQHVGNANISIEKSGESNFKGEFGMFA
jgi:hypothetical protein